MKNVLNKRVETLSTKDRGFTIIEVMIVLAVAALIMLVVFLAVPALQRSQRNNARHSDASRVAAAVIDFVSNNQNKLPTLAADCTNLTNSIGISTLSQYTTMTTCASPVATGMPTFAQAPTNNFVLAADLSAVAAGTAAPVNASGVAPANTMILADKAQCASSSTVNAGTASQAALLFTVEAGASSYGWACQNVQ